MTSSVDASGAQTNFTYNNMGRMITRTNPFPQGGTPGPVTTYAYDPVGRNTVVTLPGGNTVQTSYTNSAIVTVTDQVNRKIKRETDGLGRLIKVTEQDVATGALTQETTYTYDLADRLIGVNQGNQTRAFKYDSEGRLLFERIPEQTATINDGTGTFWTSRYTYTDWGAVAAKQDARGVITTFGYDTLHRLIALSYNTVSGVTTAPAVSYSYDNTVGSTTKGLLLSLSVGSAYSETYSYNVGYGNGGNGGNKVTLASATKVMDGRSYATSYQSNAANQLTQMTYPSGRVIGFGHDNKGRVTSVGSFLNSVTHNAIGQLTGTTLGNGVTEGYGYDANRMQLTSQTATQSGGPANGLMNLTYGYQASAGQMGAGTTAGNAGQLMSISGTIGGLTESGAYTYDDLGRLVTSNQTSNTSSAQRRFAYDRWGNRTGMWDAVSGGNQIQSITLQQSGGAPTNRITSVTSGSTLNYTYDAAGNVTSDGVHSFGYDSENRIVSVDGGSTASYAYDNQNRRYKKTVGSTATHYVWEGSQVLAEHNVSTGAVLIDYVYSESRMIAKVASGSTQYFLSDRLSVRLSLDSSGNVIGHQGHLPFGEDFGESGTQEKRHFTSYESDAESAADYAVNREYAQSVGRFMRVDSVRNSSRTQSYNRFTYAHNDPVNSMDPLGLQSLTICFWSVVGLLWDMGDGTGGLLIGIVPQGCLTIDGGFGLIPAPNNPPDDCDRARDSTAKPYKLANDTRTDYENWIKHIGEQSGQSAAIDSWLNELHSDNDAVDNAIEMAGHLGPILRTAASAYANGKKDIHKLEGKLTKWMRAFGLSLAAAEKVKKDCNDSSDYDRLFAAKPWNDAFFDESSKIFDDILKDWTPPH